MEKGHFGHYTGNARHSRKEEMIHDRELIYDAKKQLHHADQDYKSDSPAQMNADLAYDPVNDIADSPMGMYGKKENPIQNSGLGPKEAGSGAYIGPPAEGVGKWKIKKKTKEITRIRR